MGEDQAGGKTPRRAAFPAARAGRRPRSETPRRDHVTAWYTVEEYGRVLANAAATRMAVSAWVAEASLIPPSAPRPSASTAGGTQMVDKELLDELVALRRQLRGACNNLNQAVAKLHALGQPVGELPAIAVYVQRVAGAVEETVTAVRDSR